MEGSLGFSRASFCVKARYRFEALTLTNGPENEFNEAGFGKKGLNEGGYIVQITSAMDPWKAKFRGLSCSKRSDLLMSS